MSASQPSIVVYIEIKRISENIKLFLGFINNHNTESQHYIYTMCTMCYGTDCSHKWSDTEGIAYQSRHSKQFFSNKDYLTKHIKTFIGHEKTYNYPPLQIRAFKHF